MNQIAKKGDMAVIAPWARNTPGERNVLKTGRGHRHQGMQCAVLSNPEVPRRPEDWAPGVLISEVRAQCGCQAWTHTNYLIPIRDPDQQTALTTDREVAA